MNFAIRRAEGTLARRDQIINLVVDRMKLSEQHYSGVRLRLPRLYDLWRGVYVGRFHPHKNNVHIPLIFSAIWADAARKATTSLNSYPVVRFLGFGPDDTPIARKREALISAQMQDIDMFRRQIDNFVTADLYGVSITQVMWRRTEEFRIIEDASRLPLSGKVVRSIKKGKVVMFDGPDIENVDRLDAFPQPNVKDIPKMKWFIRRHFLDLDDCRVLAREGIFDTDELARMEREGGVSAGNFTDEALTRRFQVRTGHSDDEARALDRYSRPVELLEYWGYIPSELADDDVLCRVITVANRRYLFRNRGNPFWHGKLPFISYSPMPDPHYFDAPGKAEVAEKLQITANRYINQALDAADLIIDPMWFYSRDANLNTRNLFVRPGKFIPVDGDPNKVIGALMPQLAGLSTAKGMIDDVSRYLQMGTGIYDDAIQGASGSDRQTAREFLGRREAAGTRLLLESRLYESQYLEPLANMMVALDKQFLELPTEVLILGDNAHIDPVTQQPIVAGHEQLDGFDLVPNYAARAIGATSALSRDTTQQHLLQLVQTIAAFPQVMGAVNVVNFWRGIFREFEIPNVNELFIPAPQNPLTDLVNRATGGQGGIQNVPSTSQMVQGQLPQMQGQMPIPGNPGIPQNIDLTNTLQGMNVAA